MACDTETVSANCPAGYSGELVVNIDGEGSIYVLSGDPRERLDGEAARDHIAATLREDPCTRVFVAGDPQAPAEAVDVVFALLRDNGAQYIGVAAGAEP